MKDFETLEKEFHTYNPLVFDLSHIEKTDIIGSTYDVQFSNSICFPEFKLGFHLSVSSITSRVHCLRECVYSCIYCQ